MFQSMWVKINGGKKRLRWVEPATRCWLMSQTHPGQLVLGFLVVHVDANEQLAPDADVLHLLFTFPAHSSKMPTWREENAIEWRSAKRCVQARATWALS
jgi:hypothetical protein